MGYDDNTPLTGVTGGGLPAEIWHETMTRVLDGVTPRPLPMAPAGRRLGRLRGAERARSPTARASPWQPTGDPAVDAALAAAFGPPPGEGDAVARRACSARWARSSAGQ